MDPDLQEPLPRVYDLFIRLISDDDKEYKMFRRIVQKQLARLVNEFDIQKHTSQIVHQDVITFTSSVVSLRGLFDAMDLEGIGMECSSLSLNSGTLLLLEIV